MRIKLVRSKPGWSKAAIVLGTAAALVTMWSLGPDLLRYIRIKTM